MSSIRIRTGNEGPIYDPYSFREVIFTRTDGVVVTYHGGLGEWCTVEFPNGKSFNKYTWWNDEAAKAFEDLTGLHPAKAQHIYDRLHPYVKDPMGCLANYE